jgi:hypothetical protein
MDDRGIMSRSCRGTKHSGVADLRYDGLRNWDILELKVVD